MVVMTHILSELRIQLTNIESTIKLYTFLHWRFKCIIVCFVMLLEPRLVHQDERSITMVRGLLDHQPILVSVSQQILREGQHNYATIALPGSSPKLTSHSQVEAYIH